MIRWTIFLCVGLYLALQIGGEDRGQKRLGLVEAELEAAADAERLAAKQLADATAANEVPSHSTVNRDAAVVNVAFSPSPTLITVAAKADPEETAAPVEAAAGGVLTQLMYVTGRSVNVRGGPSTRNPVVGKLGRGDAVSVVWVEENGWARIRVEGDGVDGYMALDFLTEQAPIN